MRKKIYGEKKNDRSDFERQESEKRGMTNTFGLLMNGSEE